MEKSKFFLIIGQVLFAILGASAKWLSLSKKKRQRTLLAELLLAVFGCGLVISLHYLLSFPDPLAFALCGLAGYGGPKFIEMLDNWFTTHAKLKGGTQHEDQRYP